MAKKQERLEETPKEEVVEGMTSAKVAESWDGFLGTWAEMERLWNEFQERAAELTVADIEGSGFVLQKVLQMYKGVPFRRMITFFAEDMYLRGGFETFKVNGEGKDGKDGY